MLARVARHCTNLSVFSHQRLAVPCRHFCAPPTLHLATLSILQNDDLHRLLHRLTPLVLSAHSQYTLLASRNVTSALSDEDTATLRTLTPLITVTNRIHSLRDALTDTSAMLNDPSSDDELRQLAHDELQTLHTLQSPLTAELLPALLSSQVQNRPADPPAAIMEIRAGTGGDEAALFAAELTDMYIAFAATSNWRVTELSRTTTSLRGVREVVLRILGTNAHSNLAGEAGVHRVQRVPATEGSGRIHTSTASVAVLRDSGSTKVPTLNPSDVRIDVYRASGAGGQHVNTTESAVRATHIPTGLVATSQDERSQHRNRATALAALAARVAAAAAAKTAQDVQGARRAQLGAVAGERSDRIRTYNFPQKRVTDHRIIVDARVAKALPDLTSRMPNKSAPLAQVMQGGPQLSTLMEGVQVSEGMVAIGDLLDQADAKRSEESDIFSRDLSVKAS